ncbi:MAG: helix-turn-helix transcriptional regulator [Hyphomicrobiales bacterium]|nr:helix-turn-helix transcriptional regulator [Hyphomicrobiales bacterium]
MDGTAFHFPAVWLVKRTGGVLRQSGLVAPSVEGGFVDDLREVLRLRFADSELSLAVVANEAARSVSTLRRALQRADTSFRRELDSVRSSAACQMLALSDKSISGIGADVGYPDAASFNRAFRRWKGVTPGEFRRTLPAG